MEQQKSSVFATNEFVIILIPPFFIMITRGVVGKKPEQVTHSRAG